MVDVPGWRVTYGLWWTPKRTSCTIRSGDTVRLVLTNRRIVTVTVPDPHLAVQALDDPASADRIVVRVGPSGRRRDTDQVTDAPERLLDGEPVPDEPARPRRVAEADDDPLLRSARVHEYTRAANPIGAGITPRIPIRSFPASLPPRSTRPGSSRSTCRPSSASPGPATSPALLRLVRPHRARATRSPPRRSPHPSSYYVIAGVGLHRRRRRPSSSHWGAGDVFVLPAGLPATHRADGRRHLLPGHRRAAPALPRRGARRAAVPAPPTSPPRWLEAELALVEAAPHAARPQPHQRAARHRRADPHPHHHPRAVGHVRRGPGRRRAAPAPPPVGGPRPHHRLPPGLLHARRPHASTTTARSSTRSGSTGSPAAPSSPRPACGTPTTTSPAQPAYLLPVQDAGLHTYLRTLDIRFA